MEASSQFPVILVNGARQVGKTTLVRERSEPERGYVTLDDPLQLALAREDPALFVQRHRPPLVIDEIQYAPQLLPYIKMIVDEDRRPGSFWLTGSQHFHMMRDVSESLAGRVGVLRLAGLSRREIEQRDVNAAPFLPTTERLAPRLASGERLPSPELYRIIWRGALPAIAADTSVDRDLFYGSYVQTYLQRDVRDLTQVGDEMAFLRFMRAAAARSGQTLNLVALARDADVSPNTAKRWLSVLRASFVVHLVEAFHTNRTTRLVKSPKLYFLDAGLCAYLTGWSSPHTLESGAMSGPILKTWVVAEILKSYWHNGREAPFFTYRDKEKREIDLLIEIDGALHPLEIKRTASPSKRDTKIFAALERLGEELGEGGLVCLAERSLPLSDNARSIPVAAL
ncbi:MAG: ATP-binding protein [Polyangia bacterium]